MFHVAYFGTISLTIELTCRQHYRAQSFEKPPNLDGDKTFEKPHAVGGQVQRLVRLFSIYFLKVACPLSFFCSTLSSIVI